ncbi:MAG: hypothetical protein ACE5DQ_01420, partial [Candidatus Paceibacterota bacterium]
RVVPPLAKGEYEERVNRAYLRVPSGEQCCSPLSFSSNPESNFGDKEKCMQYRTASNYHYASVI